MGVLALFTSGNNVVGLGTEIPPWLVSGWPAWHPLAPPPPGGGVIRSVESRLSHPPTHPNLRGRWLSDAVTGLLYASHRLACSFLVWHPYLYPWSLILIGTYVVTLAQCSFDENNCLLFYNTTLSKEKHDCTSFYTDLKMLFQILPTAGIFFVS